MQVLILGGGSIGSSIARTLSSEHSVTLIETNPDIVKALNSDLDIRAIQGSATQSSTLFQAGVGNQDICLALTGVDEVNIIGASIAHAMGVPRTAARVYAQIYRDLSTFDYRHHFGIDKLLSIENLTACELACEIKEPCAMFIEHFGYEDIEMQEVAVTKTTSANETELGKLNIPPDVRIGTICRGGEINIATAEDRVLPGDKITLIGNRTAIEALKRVFQIQSIIKQNVTIAGGGETGYLLALILQTRNYNVKIIEADKTRCEFLAAQLDRSTIIIGDGSRKKVLEEENVNSSTVFVSCLGDDENNIMACVEARELGAKDLITVINRPDYAEVIGKLGITKAISPKTILNRQIKGLMQQGPIVFQNPHLLGGNIDVIELSVSEGAPITKSPLKEGGLPKQVLILAVNRGAFTFVPNADTIIQPKDNVVAIVHQSCFTQLLDYFIQ